MSWTADSIQITADQTCWTADGSNNCQIQAGSGYPVIIYETIPKKTVKRIIRKIKKYKSVEKTHEISKEAIEAIVNVMVDTWEQKDMKEKMQRFDISQEVAIQRYKDTIRQLINDDELALILILASI